MLARTHITCLIVVTRNQLVPRDTALSLNAKQGCRVNWSPLSSCSVFLHSDCWPMSGCCTSLTCRNCAFKKYAFARTPVCAYIQTYICDYLYLPAPMFMNSRIARVASVVSVNRLCTGTHTYIREKTCIKRLPEKLIECFNSPTPLKGPYKAH